MCYLTRQFFFIYCPFVDRGPFRREPRCKLFVISLITLAQCGKSFRAGDNESTPLTARLKFNIVASSPTNVSHWPNTYDDSKPYYTDSKHVNTNIYPRLKESDVTCQKEKIFLIDYRSPLSTRGCLDKGKSRHQRRR